MSNLNLNQNYSEQEQNNLKQIQRELEKSSNYVTIGSGQKALLQFVLSKKIEEVEKTYNDQVVKKVRFFVVDVNSGSSQERIFDVGKRSARLILAKLNEGHTLLKIERVGSGKETLYVPTETNTVTGRDQQQQK